MIVSAVQAIDWYTQHHPCALHFSSLVVLP